MKLSNNTDQQVTVTGLMSVIVPVYKVERYLEECVDSILGQTYTNFEVILVDDGSPDNSGAICDRYATEYPGRVRVVHKPNGGLSSARNAGLDVARGEFVSFVDSDDTILPTMFAEAIESINRSNADIVCTYFHRTNERRRPIPPPPRPLTLSGIEALEMLHDFGIDCSSCTKIYRHSLIETLRFADGLTNEDYPFVCYAFMKASKVYVLPKAFYVYRVNTGSISQNMTDSFFDLFYNLNTIRGVLPSENKSLRSAFVFYELRMHIFSAVRIVQNRFNSKYKTWLRINRSFILRHLPMLLFDRRVSMRERMKAVYGFLHLPARISS